MGRVPFADVAIHCVVQTADGQRMSKSKGNTLDPRDMIRKYGVDAVRAWAASVAMSGQDVRFDETRIEGFKRFANKLWNATRLVLNGLGEDLVPVPAPDAELRLIDRWILSRLQATIRGAGRGIEDYLPQVSINGLYDFAWHDFCDWYLEAVKPRLRDADPAARAVSLHVLDVLLRLLHPFMPFVTEELWHRLPDERDFLIRSPWPEASDRFDAPEAEASIARLIAMVDEIRRIRQAAGAPRRGGRLRFEQPVGPEIAELAADLAAVQVVDELAGPGVALTELPARLELPVAEVDHSANAAARKRLEDDLARARAKLSNQEFLDRAPAAVVEKERARLAEITEALERLGAGAPR
jgi:valyl-tRNA synthetase